MSFQDRSLTCRDCNREFVFTAAEQEFYARKGVQSDPDAVVDASLFGMNRCRPSPQPKSGRFTRSPGAVIST